MHIRWRGLELPSLVTCETKTLTSTYGKFVAEPFERGFGVTIGNGLRRILLSSLEGSSITQIKVQGAQHEFTTLPGVVEDMTDIVLNVKSLVVKNYSESTKVVVVAPSRLFREFMVRAPSPRRHGLRGHQIGLTTKCGTLGPRAPHDLGRFSGQCLAGSRQKWGREPIGVNTRRSRRRSGRGRSRGR